MYRKCTKAEGRPSAFVGVGCFTPDEERVVLLKSVVQVYFIYGVLRGFLYIYYTLITSLFIYCVSEFTCLHEA